MQKMNFRYINFRFEKKVAAIDVFVKRGYNTVNKLLIVCLMIRSHYQLTEIATFPLSYCWSSSGDVVE